MKALLSRLTAMLAIVPAGLRTFFVHMLTGKDNATFDVSRVLLLGSGVTFLGIAVFHVIATNTWDPVAFGAGTAGVLGGGAAGVRVKAITEPDASAPAETKPGP